MNKQFSSAGRRYYDADTSGSGSASSQPVTLATVKKGFCVRTHTATIITAIVFNNTRFTGRFEEVLEVEIPAGSEEFFPPFSEITFSQGKGFIEEQV